MWHSATFRTARRYYPWKASDRPVSGHVGARYVPLPERTMSPLLGEASFPEQTCGLGCQRSLYIRMVGLPLNGVVERDERDFGSVAAAECGEE